MIVYSSLKGSWKASSKISIMLVVALIALAFVLVLGLCGCQNQDEGESDAANSETTTTSESSSDEGGATEGEYCPVTVRFDCVNSWEADNVPTGQYNISLANVTDKKVTSWELALSGADGVTVSDSWNCTLAAKGDMLTLAPASYNAEIVAQDSVVDIGFIAGPHESLALSSLTVTFGDGSQETYNAEQLANTKPVRPPTDKAQTHASNTVASFSQAGTLQVQGTGLVDEQGNPVQLRGVSTHGLAWFPQYVNKDAFATLHHDWGANVVRLAMYTAESGGYCTDGDKKELLDLIDKGVRAATDADMYVIIDWHILSDGNPTEHQKEALDFFDTVSKRYADCDNVIYEVCNEPQNSPFVTVIKPYAEKVLKVIRAHDKDAVVLVGTNTWSQDIDEVIDNRIADDNVMYTQHFYASTHKDAIREKLTRALDAGVPVFVSECSITDASGNGSIDGESAAAWLELLNGHNVSFVAWSLSNKNESSALIDSSSQATSGWADDELSETGLWFKEAISNS